MKHTVKIVGFLLLSAIILTIGACKKDEEQKVATGYLHIPSDAFAVVVIDGAELLKLYKPEMLKNNEEIAEAIDGLESESPKIAELVNSFLSNPDASGIILSKKSYAFSVMNGEDVIIGVIIPIEKKTFDQNLDIIEDELNFKVTAMMEKKDDFLYMEPDKGVVLGWNNEIIMVVINQSSSNSIELFEKYMKLKESESINSNPDFVSFHKECKSINLWISSDVIEKTAIKDNEDLKEFEELTGIKIAGNYGHVHIGIKKDEITYISKLKFNESIQNLDIEKLYNNADLLTEFFDNINWDSLNVFDDGSELTEEEINANWQEEYPGITREEYDQIMKDLEEQNF